MPTQSRPHPNRSFMLNTIALLKERACLTSIVGAVSGWLGVLNLTYAREWMQFIASFTAFLVSFCALIISMPIAISKVKSWFRRSLTESGQK